MYVLLKILKFCTGSSAKSYQCKFALSDALRNRAVSDVEELGDVIQKVIHHYTLRGKFSSIHPELRREGIIRVEVGKEGLHFIRDSGVDRSDGPFFSAMEWLMFLFRPPLTTMVFQWFYHHWTITIECFWRVQPLVSMVFQWFLKF